MRKTSTTPRAADPEAYVASLQGWPSACVRDLRSAVRSSAELEEVVKWGHLVYLSNGPVLLIRAENRRVLFGFWRGQRLRAFDERLKPGGKYEMATLELREDLPGVDAALVARLTREAVALNAVLGNPTLPAGIGAARTSARSRPGASALSSPLETTCHCGAVRIALARRPQALTICDCSICRRYGTLWAYFAPAEVRITAAPGALQTYAWGPRSLQFVRCGGCGSITHWEPIGARPKDRMGVNGRMFDPGQLGAVRIRRLDGAVTEQYLDD